MDMKINPRDYDSETAMWMARFSACAYLSEPAGLKRAEKWGLRYERVEHAGAQAILLGSDKFCVLSYAGTDPRDLRDIAADVSCGQVPGPFGERDKVHAGFAAYVKLTRHRVHHALVGFLSNRQKLFLCGHSLGAAVATIARAEMRNRTEIAGTYLFGSPRVGNRAFSTLLGYLCQNTWRHTNHNDFAHWIPWQFGRYRHVGDAWYYFDRKGIRHKDPMLPWVLWDKWAGTRGGLLSLASDSVGDHSVRAFEMATFFNAKFEGAV